MKTIIPGRHSVFKQFVGGLLVLGVAATLSAQTGAPPVIYSVSAAQQPGTKLVNILYTIADTDSTNVSVFIKVSKDSGATWTVPASTFSGDYGANISVTPIKTLKQVVWNAGADWDGHFTSNCRVRVIANDAGMMLVPGGTYTRGNYLSGGFKDVDITDAPPSQVTISGFLMDSAPVTGGQWSLIAEGYAQSHGYTFDNGGVVKSGSYPMQNVNWYDAVKWCNARSENEGASPVYFSDAAFSTVYRSGHTAPYIKPGANGYRLPTEAEWEIAARGGLSGVRFPLSNTVSQAQANYWSCNDTNKCGPLAYDLGPPGLRGTTTLVGSFPPNGYGLFDMAGNVSEWCWDWYDPNYYNTQITSDPQGPVSGTTCVWRGGSYADTASVLRCAYRGNLDPLQGQYYDIGFRCVRAF